MLSGKLPRHAAGQSNHQAQLLGCRRGKAIKNTSSEDKTMTKARPEIFPGCARMSPKTRTNNPETIVLPRQNCHQKNACYRAGRFMWRYLVYVLII